jgi:hypothetical protein
MLMTPVHHKLGADKTWTKPKPALMNTAIAAVRFKMRRRRAMRSAYTWLRARGCARTAATQSGDRREPAGCWAVHRLATTAKA